MPLEDAFDAWTRELFRTAGIALADGLHRALEPQPAAMDRPVVAPSAQPMVAPPIIPPLAPVSTGLSAPSVIGAPIFTPPPPAAPAGTPAAPPDPIEDFNRRAQNQANYQKLGSAVMDQALAPRDRMTAMEARVGTTETTPTQSKAWDERGYTRKDTSVTTETALGRDGKPVETATETSNSVNYGLLNRTATNGEKVTTTDGSGSTTIEKASKPGKPTSSSIDLLRAEKIDVSATAVDRKRADGSGERSTDKTTTTKGASGWSRTREDSVQTTTRLPAAPPPAAGAEIDHWAERPKTTQIDMKGNASTVSVTRDGGQLGVGRSSTTRQGQMEGPPGLEQMVRGTETTTKGSGSLVSDAKGTGLGGQLGHDSSEVMNPLGGNATVKSTTTLGGRVQAIVKELGGDPPLFAITTTITFSASAGHSVGGGSGQKTEGQGKGNVAVGASAGASESASFTHRLPAEDARAYIEAIEKNGHGSKLPEHQMIWSMLKDGPEAAKALWHTIGGGPAPDLKPGEEVEHVTEMTGNVSVAPGLSKVGAFAAAGLASATMKHKVSIKQTALPDGMEQLTVTVQDDQDLMLGLSKSVGMVSGTAGKDYGESKGATVVFTLKNDDMFKARYDTIAKASTLDELHTLAADPKFHDILTMRTERKGDSEGWQAGAAVGRAGATLEGKGTHYEEESFDRDGNDVGTKAGGGATSGGSLGVVQTDVKAAYSQTAGYAGETDRWGEIRGQLNKDTRQTDVTKSVKNAATLLATDPLGTVLNPSSMLQKTGASEGLELENSELLPYVTKALDVTNWNSQIIGVDQDDWRTTGEMLRKAVTKVGGEIVGIDQKAVNAALAFWSKDQKGGRQDILDRIARPFGGGAAGKGYAFPDGTDFLRYPWDNLVKHDPMLPVQDKLKAGDTRGALEDMKSAKADLTKLRADMKKLSAKWQGEETAYSEMLGHIDNRLSAIAKFVRELKKTMLPPPGAAPAKAGDTKAEDHAEDLADYKRKMETLQDYHDSAWKALTDIQKELDDTGFLSKTKVDKVIALSPMIKKVEDNVVLWRKTHDEAVQRFLALAPTEKLDRAEVDKLHPKGAADRCADLKERVIKL